MKKKLKYYEIIQQIKEIHDQDVLVKYLNDSDPFVRCAAIKNIENVKIIENEAEADQFWQVRCSAVRKIKDDSFLVKLFENENNNFVLEAIIDQIENNKLLVDLLKESKKEIKNHLKKKILDKTKDQNIILEIAKNANEDIDLRIYATKLLQNQQEKNILLKILYPEIERVDLEKEKERKTKNPKLNFFSWGFNGGFFWGIGEGVTGQTLGSFGTTSTFFFFKFLFLPNVKNPNSQILLLVLFISIAILCYSLGYSSYSKSYDKRFSQKDK